MTYGYCRISTQKQNIERQERNIKAVYADAIILKEQYTGTTTHRPLWERLYRNLKQGDVIVFDSVSRMSRDAFDGVLLYFKLYDKGIDLIFLKEPYINTQTYREEVQSKHIDRVGDETDIILQAIEEYLKAIAKKQIYIAFKQAEKEVRDLQQRTKEGMVTARLNGKQIGRSRGKKVETKKSKELKPQIIKLSKSFQGSLTDVECIKLLHIASNTYYKYKREIRQVQKII